jgi:hypothetical protein
LTRFGERAKDVVFVILEKGKPEEIREKQTELGKQLNSPDAILHYLKPTLLAAIENGKWSIKKVARLAVVPLSNRKRRRFSPTPLCRLFRQAV